jgi:hypothetical protein
VADKNALPKKEVFVLIGLGIMFLLASVVCLVIFPGSFLCYVFLALGGGMLTFGAVEYSKSKIVAVPKKLRVGSEHVKVYDKPDPDSPLIAELKEGDEIELGEINEVEGISWIQVFLPDGRKGFAFAEIEIYKVLIARTESPEVIVYEEPSLSSTQIARLSPGSALDISEGHWVRRYTDIQWIKVWFPDGQSGFVQRPIKLKWDSSPSRKMTK